MDIKEATKLINKAKRFVLSTHTSPDPDGIGSMIALASALSSLGKTVDVFIEDPLFKKYTYLDTKNIIDQSKNIKKDSQYDLFIILDANNLERVGHETKKLNMYAKDFLFIDHHPCALEVKALHLIDSNFAATGEIVANLIKELNIKFTEDMALALYTAILIDTSAFNYPTMKGRTHQIIAELLNSGISASEAFKSINSQYDLNFMHLTGKILSSCKVKNKIAYSSIIQNDLEKYGISLNDTYGMINHFIHIKDVLIACMFTELSENKTKVSFRSFSGIDVGAIASVFGGGGHTYSSATVINSPIKIAREKTLDKLSIILNKIDESLTN